MGWGEYLMGVMSRPLGEGVAGESTGGLIKHHKHKVDKEQYPTHPIPEYHDEDNEFMKTELVGTKRRILMKKRRSWICSSRKLLPGQVDRIYHHESPRILDGVMVLPLQW